jgi:tRNA-splicing ligase RtcB (3'-phosphate/5'-hydroxy nucleic acid ligase)
MQIKNLHRVSDYEWLIPRHGEMNVDGVIIGSQKLIEEMDDNVYKQLKNVASLPGILEKAIALPDAHSGYGFPIGCVACFDKSDGIVSVGGVGFDINCGVRMVTTNLIYQDIEKKVETLLKAFYKAIPCGVGAAGKISLSKKDLMDVLQQGARWVIKNRGMGREDEMDYLEDGGELEGADPYAVSEEALKREKNQLGTLGSGNHYVELQIVDEVFDIEKARVFGLFKNQVVVSLHTGSRGLGHQVGTDYIKVFSDAARKYGIKVKDRELLYVPAASDEGKRYLGAVRAASNFAFANRQVISYYIHDVFNDVIKDVETNTMYDVGHNTIKEETHKIGTSRRQVLVHRKGSTRNFSGKMQEISRPYRVSGQPVIVGGSMGTASYVLVGREESIAKTFASTVHGAGRVMSRHQAKDSFDFDHLSKELAKKHIILKAKSREGALEEAPEAYKDIEEVIQSISKAGLSQRVARLKPIGVMKG